jgi:threonine dehydratase
MVVDKKGIEEAHNRITSFIRETPLLYSSSLSTEGARVFLKMENLQLTGSFKLRGALNKLFSLNKNEIENGVVTASTGNHGLAFAHGLQFIKTKGTIFVPLNVKKSKFDKLIPFPVEIEKIGEDTNITENYARNYADDNKKTYVSPYNDPLIIEGQGTIAIEIVKQFTQFPIISSKHKQNSSIDYAFITVGGGGLISGIATYLKSEYPNVKIIGCQPKNSPVMYESVKNGKIVDIESLETLSDGSAGGIEETSITFPIVQRLVDDFVLVSEKEISNAIRFIFENEFQVVEGAAAVAVAAYRKLASNIKGNVIIVICGGNIGIENFKSIVF